MFMVLELSILFSIFLCSRLFALWLQRRLPEVRNESFHLASRTSIDAANTDIPMENHIINDFGKYVRDKFGEKVCKFLFS